MAPKTLWLRCAALGLLLTAFSSCAPPLAPTPTRTPGPTATLIPITPSPALADEALLEAQALAFIAQQQNVPVTDLEVKEFYVIPLPLTQKTLWQGYVHNPHATTPTWYFLEFDAATHTILGGDTTASQYWQAEAAAFREQMAPAILASLAQREGVPVSEVKLVEGGVLRHYPLTGYLVWEGKADSTTLRYRITVNGQGQVIDPTPISQAESALHLARYGKLSPDFFYFLQDRNPDELIPVRLSPQDIDLESINNELAQRYPNVGAYRFASGQPIDEKGRPMPIDPELFDAIRRDYNALLDAANLQAGAALVDYLQTLGYTGQASDFIPGVTAELPAHLILTLSRADLPILAGIGYNAPVEIMPYTDQVELIPAGPSPTPLPLPSTTPYLPQPTPTPLPPLTPYPASTQDHAAVPQTLRVQTAWDLGVTGQSVRVGVFEGSVISSTTVHGVFSGKTLINAVTEPTH